MDIKILVVEDDEHIGKAVRAFLRDAGCQVELCADGNTAHERIYGNRYQLIILDNVINNHGLSPRIPAIEQMREETAAWNRRRNKKPENDSRAAASMPPLRKKEFYMKKITSVFCVAFAIVLIFTSCPTGTDPGGNNGKSNVIGVNLQYDPLTIPAGETKTLTANVVIFSGDRPANTAVTWAITAGSAYAEITGSATANPVSIKGKAAGNATITVTTQDGGYTDTCEIEVTQYQSQYKNIDFSQFYNDPGNTGRYNKDNLNISAADALKVINTLRKIMGENVGDYDIDTSFLKDGITNTTGPYSHMNLSGQLGCMVFGANADASNLGQIYVAGVRLLMDDFTIEKYMDYANDYLCLLDALSNAELKNEMLGLFPSSGTISDIQTQLNAMEPHLISAGAQYMSESDAFVTFGITMKDLPKFDIFVKHIGERYPEINLNQGYNAELAEQGLGLLPNGTITTTGQ
jgi:hypothetical protein